jgi:outer membrane lipase/esterase
MRGHLMKNLKKAIVAASLLLAAPAHAAATFSGLYVFGDSLSDGGNIASLIGTNPGQVISSNFYIPSQPYGSGTFSDGPVWVNAFAAGLGLAPFGAPTLAGGGNFAFGGARTNTDGVGFPPSANTQVTQFLGATGGAAPSGALYVVAIGGNDARDALQAAATSANPLGVISSAATNYASSVGSIVDRLQAAGAANIIVWNAPNLGLAPAVRSQGAAAAGLGTTVSSQFNLALSARMLGEPSTVSTFDLFGLLGTVTSNPSVYGLTNVTNACGAVSGCNPQNYLFWDGIHPTARGQQILSAALLAQVNAAAVPEPATWALMIFGFGAVGAQMRRRGRETAKRPLASAG